LLNSSDNNLKDQKLLTKAELKAIESMNLEEVKYITSYYFNDQLVIYLNFKIILDEAEAR
jgi:hypothetical protein